MFFDFSGHKSIVLVAVVLLLVVAVLSSFAALSHTQRIVADIEDTFAHDRAALVYWMQYKLPAISQNALAYAGITVATSTSVVASAQDPHNGPARSIPVLVYHGEGSSLSKSMSMNVFVNQMRALRNNGWHTVTMAQFEKFMQGKEQLPAKSFLLTFDDGRTDTYYAVDPLLKDYGYTAVMFVITGLSLPNNSNNAVSSFYLSKANLQAMAASGRWDIESHGNDDHLRYAVPTATSTAGNLSLVQGQHFLSNLFWVKSQQRIETIPEYTTRVTNDLTYSRDLLENDLGKPVTAFAYPFNDFGEDTYNFPGAQAQLAQIVPKIYSYAFYQTWAGNGDSFNYPDPNAYLVKRIEPLDSWSGAKLLSVLRGGRAKNLPYTANTFGIDWQPNWGIATTTTDSKALSLKASQDTTGAAAFLDGTEWWTNYHLQAMARWYKGTFSLIARHTEKNQPYLVCAFSQNRIYLERHTTDTQVTLASARYSPPALGATITANMSVDGSTATCSAYGVSVHSSVPSVSANGGVGASVWDPARGAAHAAITNISVQAL